MATNDRTVRPVSRRAEASNAPLLALTSVMQTRAIAARGGAAVIVGWRLGQRWAAAR